MYKTLTISILIMILSFSGYIGEENSSKVLISVEIGLPGDSVVKKIETEEIQDIEDRQKKQVVESSNQSIVDLRNTTVEEQEFIHNFIIEYQSPIELIVSNDKNHGTLTELKPLLQNYYAQLIEIDRAERIKQLEKKQELFWQHDRYIDHDGQIRGIYLNGYLYGDSSFRDSIHNLINTTRINTVVLDVKSDNGHVLFESTIKKVVEINAIRKKYDKEDLYYYKKNNIYLIGRLVAFQDPLYVKKFTDSAVWDTRTDSLYRQGNQYFIDPSDNEARQYILNIAIEACRLGFNEIQFDYIRYPDSNYKYMRFDTESTLENRTQVINSFLLEAQETLHSEGCLVSADIFGYVLTNKLDGGIGQNFESILTSVDFVSPMIYPSHYSKGSYGFTSPNSHPYEVVSSALEDGLDRVENRYPLRPYLQGFWHTNEEIREGIRAAEDKNLSWIMWNSLSNYTEELFQEDR